MTSFLVLNRYLHNISLRAQQAFFMVEHLCAQYHGQQIRDDGSSYMDHVYDVMRQIIEFYLAHGKTIDWAVVAAGGCHDLIEDSYKSVKPIDSDILYGAFAKCGSIFTNRVALMVDSVSKKPRSAFSDKESRLREYHDRLFDWAYKEPMILVIKYADRIHNLSTLHALTTTDPSKVQRVARETIDFYVPMGQTKALEILPRKYHDYFSRRVEHMRRLALAYLIDDYDIDSIPLTLPDLP
ncbi:MAG: HD domain-containing protein [Candidatus Berkelbacteria bacterium]